AGWPARLGAAGAGTAVRGRCRPVGARARGDLSWPDGALSFGPGGRRAACRRRPAVSRSGLCDGRACDGVVGCRRPVAGGAMNFTEEGHYMKRRTFVGAAAASVPAFSILTAGDARAQSKEIR